MILNKLVSYNVSILRQICCYFLRKSKLLHNLQYLNSTNNHNTRSNMNVLCKSIILFQTALVSGNSKSSKDCEFMKLFNLLVFVCVTWLNGYTQNSNPFIIKQNRNVINTEEVITSPAKLFVSLAEPAIDGRWFVEYLTIKDKYETINIVDDYGLNCIIDPQLDKDGRGHVRESQLQWALVPSRPILKNVHFSYTYDWTDDTIFPNGIFSFDVDSDSKTWCWLYVSESYIWEIPVIYAWCEKFDAIESKHIEYPADWGEFVYITANNEFGFSLSDVLYTTDYITDEDILNRINEIRETSSIDEVNIDMDTIETKWNNNTLLFSKEVDNVFVFSINGQLLRTATKCNSFDLSFLSSGVYFVKYNYNSKSSQTKIYKR